MEARALDPFKRPFLPLTLVNYLPSSVLFAFQAMDSMLQIPSHSQIVYLEDKSVVVRSVQTLHKERPTVCRLELDQPRLGLPEKVIVKQKKEDGDDEFRNETLAYERLKALQGTLIPTLLGQGSFNGRPALILSVVDGVSLRKLAETDVDEQTAESQLEKALKILHENGVEYGDPNLGNFLFCKNGEVVIVDLEEVSFPDKLRPWEGSVNRRNADYLMWRFRYIRDPDRPRTPPVMTVTTRGPLNGLGQAVRGS
ncbi:hypothetical protein N7474_004972 [Penicillium riverlandense]|uniref:uncharacterized protein n=1 Tax=Penicillium riverlandense TaxID=1903569 RepID=UPI002548E3D0|nr:uncharacterized protein N7474_004972 [Penicillium riverlandense]KAJ5819381.1 hypothetical protein N7474_004972 [Penicillium riverlandense]